MTLAALWLALLAGTLQHSRHTLERGLYLHFRNVVLVGPLARVFLWGPGQSQPSHVRLLLQCSSTRDGHVALGNRS